MNHDEKFNIVNFGELGKCQLLENIIRKLVVTLKSYRVAPDIYQCHIPTSLMYVIVQRILYIQIIQNKNVITMEIGCHEVTLSTFIQGSVSTSYQFSKI